MNLLVELHRDNHNWVSHSDDPLIVRLLRRHGLTDEQIYKISIVIDMVCTECHDEYFSDCYCGPQFDI